VDSALLDRLAQEVCERTLALLQERLPEIPKAPSPYVTIPEAATLLRCSRQRIDDLLSRGAFPRLKEGRRTLIARVEIEAHLRGGVR
jgi:excisionase family DNA binding protein